MNLASEYNMALPYQEYVDMLGNNLNIHELHYKKFSIDKKIAAKISGYKRLIILIITEPWCGDSLALLPIIRKTSVEDRSPSCAGVFLLVVNLKIRL